MLVKQICLLRTVTTLEEEFILHQIYFDLLNWFGQLRQLFYSLTFGGFGIEVTFEGGWELVEHVGAV